MTVVLDKNIPFTTTLIPVTQSTIDNEDLVQVLSVNCENFSKSVKPYTFLNFQCRRKTCIKNNFIDCHRQSKQTYDGSYAEHLSRTVFPKYQKGN